MNRPADLEFHYDRRTIALHWVIAVLVVVLWCVGQTIDFFPRGLPRISARSVHIVLGALLVPLVVLRIVWRGTGARRLPAAAQDRAQAIATAGHLLLYALLAAAVALGLANAWVRGDSIFRLFTIAKFAPGNDALREQVEDLHALVVNVLFSLAAAHAALALVHHYVLRDRVLRRMTFGE